MSTDVGIRVASAADLASLVELRRAWATERGDGGADDGFPDRFRDWFDRERHQRTFWLATGPDGQAIGMVNLLTFDRMPSSGRDSGRWGYLGNLYVQPAHRGAGIGGRLLDALLAAADGAGLERVVLRPSERSVPLYRRAGFDAAHELLLRPGTRSPSSVVSRA